MKVVILGGGSAGTSAALELRKRDKDCEILILEKTSYNEYSPCSLPYVLCGEIKDFENIMLFTDDEYLQNNIILKKNCNIKSIETNNNKVIYEFEGNDLNEQYDYLIYALGSIPILPPIENIENTNHYFLRNLDDAKKLKEVLHENKKIIILGAGLIGIEAAYAAIKNKMQVTLIERENQLLKNTLDSDMSIKLEENLKNLGISIIKNTIIIKADENKLYSENNSYEYDVLVIATGLSPNANIAKDSGINVNHGIIVDSSYRTNIPNVFASGDCVEIERMNNNADCVMLGSIAYQSARIIANNILENNNNTNNSDNYNNNKSSNNRKPVLGASIAKLGNIIIASTGSTLEQAKNSRINAYGMIIEGSTRSGYHPDAKRIIIKLIADSDYNLLGAQIIGGEDVSGRINLCSLAISEKIKLDKLAFLETVYNPGSAPINEPISTCAKMLIRKIDVINSAK
jgi:NADH oxidase (H2O2-forming)